MRAKINNRPHLILALNLTVVLIITLAAVTGCSPRPAGPLRIMIPNAPGSGYDLTARQLSETLVDERLARDVDVYNVPGAGGVTGLAKLTYAAGDPSQLMMMGLGMIGAEYTADQESPGWRQNVAGTVKPSLGNVTPIARLIIEPEVIMVPSSSRYHNFAELADDWRRHPSAMVVGGGSRPGGPDFLATELIADAIGIRARAVRYRVYDGGGPLLAALHTGNIPVAVSGASENLDQIRAGQLRVLAIAGTQRIAGVQAPTMRELGFDVEAANWRGVVAPPDLTDDQQQQLIELLRRLHRDPAWQQTLTDNGWTDAFLPGDRFGAFIAGEERRVDGVMVKLNGRR